MESSKPTSISSQSLRYTVPGALLLFTFLVALWAYLQNVRLNESQVERDAIASLTLEAAGMQRTLDYMFSNDVLEQVQQELAEKRADPEVEVALVIDEKDRILAAANRIAIGRPVEERLSELRVRTHGINPSSTLTNVRARQVGEVLLSPDGDMVIAFYPVELGPAPGQLRPGRVGILILARELAAKKALARQGAMEQIVGFAVPMMLFAGLLFAVLYFVITRRVNALVQTARRFAAGDTQARARLKGADELAEVGAAFDEMAGQVSSAQNVLSESEARLIKTIRCSPIALAIGRWRDRKLVDVNDAFVNLLGFTREEVIGRTSAELKIIDPADALSIREGLQDNPSLRDREVALTTRTGEIRNVIVNIESMELHGEPHLVSTFVDITARLQAEQRIRQLNRTYQVLSAFNQLIVRERDPQLILDGMCRIAVSHGGFLIASCGLQAPPGGALKLMAQAGAPPEASDFLQQALVEPDATCRCSEQAVRTGEHIVCNNIGCDAQSGSWRDEALRRGCRSMAALQLSVDGQAVGAFNLYAGRAGFFDEEEMRLLQELANDISLALRISHREKERRRAEATREVLLELATKLSAASEPPEAARTIFAAADQMWSWDSGILDIFSPLDGLVHTVLGVDIVDGERREIEVNVPGEATPRVRRIMKHGPELLLRQLPLKAEAETTMYGDKARLSASIMSVPVRWQNQAIGVLSIQSYTANAFSDEDLRTLQGLANECGGTLQRLRDVEALRTSEDRFRELAETIDDVFWISDPSKNRVLYISPAYEKIWGRTCQSLYESPRSWMDALHPEDRDLIMQAATTRQVDGSYDEEYRIVRQDGQVRWIRDRAFPVSNSSGHVARIMGVARDITERKALEEQVRQSQKMEAIGQLAGGIAHDFNNILAAILGNTELALNDDSPEESTGYLSEIKKAALRARNLVQQILAFSRQQPHERRLIALGPVIHEAIALLRATIPARVELVTTVAPDVPLVMADPTQMHQVLVNLCTNAWHAMADQPGRIEVQLEGITLDAVEAVQLEGLNAGPYMRLSVIDNGRGMDTRTLKHLFEPFFTTKEPGQGTGLGLSVVHGIVLDHDGVVTVASQPGRGATFCVYLPVAAGVPAPVPAPSPSPRRGRGQHILYLDDEEPLVILAKRMLEPLGYQVTGFTQSTEALQAFRDTSLPFDLVITDLNMPGASGIQVASEMMKLRPEVPVVLASGHVTDQLKQRARQAGIHEVLYKPNTIEEFSDTIHRLATEIRRRDSETCIAP